MSKDESIPPLHDKSQDGNNAQSLPAAIPIFPLPGVLLLPRGVLPLNIFEPRYIAMIDDALKTDRMIGMIQPRNDGASGNGTGLYETGCAGRITAFEETADQRYLVTLTGISRFRIARELESKNGFRRVAPVWSAFTHDLRITECLDIDRGSLKAMLREYFKRQNLSCDTGMMDGIPDEKLITCLSMICPFDGGEKQALLEAHCCKERAHKFMALLQMAISGSKCGGQTH